MIKLNAGGDLLSHTLPGAVPSAQVGLASGFGKGPGVTPPLTTTDKPQQNKTHTQPHPNQDPTGVSCRSRHCITDASTQPYLRQTKPSLSTKHCVEHRPISTGHLHHSHDFQIRPINPIIYREPQKKPHLRTGFPLRCFQRLSLPYVANQPCHGRDNWPTRGMSVPVLSY